MMTFLCTSTHVRYYSSTTLYYKVLLCTNPVSLCTTKYYSNTTLYYKVLLCTNPVLLCTTKSTTPVLLCTVLLQYYSVLQSTTPILLCSSKYSLLQSTTAVLLCTTKYYSSTTLYYKALLQYYVKPCRKISVNSLRPERSQIYAPSDPKFTPEAIQNLRPKRPPALQGSTVPKSHESPGTTTSISPCGRCSKDHRVKPWHMWDTPKLCDHFGLEWSQWERVARGQQSQGSGDHSILVQ